MSNSRNQEYLEKQVRILKAVLKNVTSMDGMFQELEQYDYAVEKVLMATVSLEMLAREVGTLELEYMNAFTEDENFTEYRHKHGK